MSVRSEVVEPVGRREQNKAHKRRRILQAARELFESQGFDQTTTAEISELAGVGTGTLYLYVASKEQLLFDVFAEDIGSVWAAAFDAVDHDGALLDELVGLFGSVSRYHAREPKVASTYFLELGNLVSKSPGAIDDMMQLIFDGLERTLTDAQAHGRLDEDVDAAVLGRNLFAIWNFEMVNRFAHPGSSDTAANKSFERSLTVALAGLLR